MSRFFDYYIDRLLVFYIECILIYSRAREEHLEHAREVLKWLLQHRPYASPEKCHFLKSEPSFLE